MDPAGLRSKMMRTHGPLPNLPFTNEAGFAGPLPLAQKSRNLEFLGPKIVKLSN